MRMSREYGMDVKWQAGEAGAFMVYNRMCTEQARAAFEAHKRGVAPVIRPAAELAAEARAQVAA